MNGTRWSVPLLLATGCFGAPTVVDPIDGEFWEHWVDSNFEGMAGAGDSDEDGDGLLRSEEEEYGSDPQNADTDGDGFSDGAEVDGFTDPTDADDHPYQGGWAIGACRHDIVGTGHAPGDIAENFEHPDQFGDTVRVHDFCDKAVMLVGAAFW